MQVDRRELGKHFTSLNDEELLDVKREDLTEAAQVIYDLEIARRRIDEVSAAESGIENVEASFDKLNYGGDDETADPDWHHDGAIVGAFTDTPGSNEAERASMAQTALQTARIPSHLRERREVDSRGVADYTIEVLVPVRYAMHAASILDRDFFNNEFETGWRDQLGMLSNEDLLALDPDIFCAGLLDKLARMKKVYIEEMTKREMKASINLS
jgi:hypothetical protein